MGRLHAQHAVVIGRPSNKLCLANRNYDIYEVIQGEPTMIALPFNRSIEFTVQVWIAPFAQVNNLEFVDLYRHELQPNFFMLSPVNGMSGINCHYTRDNGYVYTLINDFKAPFFLMFTKPSATPLALQISFGLANNQHPYTVRLNVRVWPCHTPDAQLHQARQYARTQQVAYNIKHRVIWRVLPFQRGDTKEYDSPFLDADDNALDRFHHMAATLAHLNEQFHPWRSVKNAEIYADEAKDLDTYLQDLMLIKPRAHIHAAAYDLGIFDRDGISKLILCHAVHEAPDVLPLDMVNFGTFYCAHTFSSCRMRRTSQGFKVHEQHRKHEPQVRHPKFTSSDDSAQIQHWYLDNYPNLPIQPDYRFANSHAGRHARSNAFERILPDISPLTTWRQRLTKLHRQPPRQSPNSDRMSPVHQTYWDLQQLHLDNTWVPYQPLREPEPLRRDQLLQHLAATTNTRPLLTEADIITAFNTFCFLTGKDFATPSNSTNDSGNADTDANTTPSSQ